jgi:hypothetical protein
MRRAWDDSLLTSNEWLDGIRLLYIHFETILRGKKKASVNMKDREVADYLRTRAAISNPSDASAWLKLVQNFRQGHILQRTARWDHKELRRVFYEGFYELFSERWQHIAAHQSLHALFFSVYSPSDERAPVDTASRLSVSFIQDRMFERSAGFVEAINETISGEHFCFRYAGNSGATADLNIVVSYLSISMGSIESWPRYHNLFREDDTTEDIHGEVDATHDHFYLRGVNGASRTPHLIIGRRYQSAKRIGRNFLLMRQTIRSVFAARLVVVPCAHFFPDYTPDELQSKAGRYSEINIAKDFSVKYDINEFQNRMSNVVSRNDGKGSLKLRA